MNPKFGRNPIVHGFHDREWRDMLEKHSENSSITLKSNPEKNNEINLKLKRKYHSTWANSDIINETDVSPVYL